MFLGRPLQLIFRDTVPNLPVWERLANLVAYPLVPVAVYQNIMTDLRSRFRHVQDVSQVSMEQMKSLLVVIAVSQQVSSSLNLSTVLDRAARGVAYTLNADQCAIALPEEDDPARLRLAGIHNPERQGRPEAKSVPIQYQLTIQRAMRGRRHVIVEESDSAQLKVLFNLLGSSETGPLLVQPLLLGGEALGAIVVGNSRSRRRFTAQETKLCQHLAGHLAGAIQNARRYEAAQSRGEEMVGASTGQSHGLRTDDRTANRARFPAEGGQVKAPEGLEIASDFRVANDLAQANPLAGRGAVAGDSVTGAGISAEIPVPMSEE